MRLVGVTGMRASGKGLFSEVANKLGIPLIEMSDCVYEMMKERGLRPTNKTIREFATRLREKYGYGIVAKKTVPEVKKINSRLVVINGIRSLAEVEVFKNTFGKNFLLVAICAPPKIRFGRVLKRRKPEDPKSFEEFEWADRKELGWGIGNAIAMADVLIDNAHDKGKAKRAIEMILK